MNKALEVIKTISAIGMIGAYFLILWGLIKIGGLSIMALEKYLGI